MEIHPRQTTRKPSPACGVRPTFTCAAKEQVGKEKAARGSRIARVASDVPFAPCRPRAGANSDIPVLAQGRLAPASGCVARREPRGIARRCILED